MDRSTAVRTGSRRLAIVVVVALAAALLPLIEGVASASTVRTVGPGERIQDAIDASAHGDVVEVRPGTYVERLDFRGRNVVVRSTDGPGGTTIDAHRTGRVVTFANNEGPSAVLEGFRIIGGDTRPVGAGSDGGGIFVDRASPTIRGNIIEGNQACNGNGIAVAFGSPAIVDNVIRDNHRVGCTGGTGGGGILLRGAGQARLQGNTITANSTGASGGGISLFAAGTTRILDNVITANEAWSQGGGIRLVNASNAIITQNLVSDNVAERGGGVAWLVPSGEPGPRLTNNTIVANTASDGAAVYADGFQDGARLTNNVIVSASGTAMVCGTDYDKGTPSFSANDIWSASGRAFGGACTDPIGTDGNISADPKVSSTGVPVPQPGSPLIDAGDPDASVHAVDLAGNPRVVDGTGDGTARLDIGAYEAAEQVVSTPSAPQNVTADHGKGRSVDVAWSAPADDGGSPITGYTVRAIEVDQTLTLSADARSATLTGIPKGTVLTIEVWATNAVGDGAVAMVRLGDGGGGDDGGGDGKPCHPKKGC